jgi:four helix bundle protein
MSLEKENIILIKSFDFSLQIIDLYKSMKAQNEYVLSKQLLRSGTSIGANVQEATAAVSKKDFAHKMSISSKEARETKYWLRLIKHSQIVSIDVTEMLEQIEELIRILTSIVKTAQQNLK